MKIAFFVSDLSNVFHQGQAAEAQKYAKEKYGAEVFVFDGKADSAVMTQNVDQIMAQGIDAATLHIWDYDAVRPAVLEAIAEAGGRDGVELWTTAAQSRGRAVTRFSEARVRIRETRAPVRISAPFSRAAEAIALLIPPIPPRTYPQTPRTPSHSPIT